MPFVVENGTGITGANSYATVAELDAYAEFRYDMTGKSTQDKQSALVVASSDWLDGQHTFNGEKLVSTQGLDFPTVGDGLPDAIKEAALKAALLQIQGLLMVDLTSISTTGEVTSESKSVGPLSKSVTYKSGSSQRYSRILPTDLTNLLKPYLAQGKGQLVYRL